MIIPIYYDKPPSGTTKLVRRFFPSIGVVCFCRKESTSLFRAIASTQSLSDAWREIRLLLYFCMCIMRKWALLPRSNIWRQPKNTAL